MFFFVSSDEQLFCLCSAEPEEGGREGGTERGREGGEEGSKERWREGGKEVRRGR